MARYKNIARAEQEDKELEELETEYRKQFGENQEDDENTEVTTQPQENRTEEDNWKKRYSDLRSYMSKKEAELQKEVEDLRKSLKEKDTDFPKNKEEAEKWVQDYPDLARVLMTLIEERTELVREDVKNVREELTRERHELEKQKALDTVLKKHPDFLELITEDNFKNWVVAQPEVRGPVIGQALYDALYKNETDAQAAIEAVNIYKADMRKTEKKNDKSAAIAVNKGGASAPQVNSDGKRKFLESEIEKLKPWEWDKLEDEIEAARREGRIVYDISGAAR